MDFMFIRTLETKKTALWGIFFCFWKKKCGEDPSVRILF